MERWGEVYKLGEIQLYKTPAMADVKQKMRSSKAIERRRTSVRAVGGYG